MFQRVLPDGSASAGRSYTSLETGLHARPAANDTGEIDSEKLEQEAEHPPPEDLFLQVTAYYMRG